MSKKNEIAATKKYMIEIFDLLCVLDIVCEHEIRNHPRKRWPWVSRYTYLRIPKVAQDPRRLKRAFQHFQQFRASLDDLEFDPPALNAVKDVEEVCQESIVITTYIAELIKTLVILIPFHPILDTPYAAESLEKKRKYILHYLRTFVVTAQRQYYPEFSWREWKKWETKYN